MKITEKVAYIKGLADGAGLDKNDKTGKVLTEILDLLGDMAEKIEQTSDDCAELKQYVEEIDEDLEVLEDEVYGDDDDECCCCDDDCDCDCDDDDCCCCDDDDCDCCCDDDDCDCCDAPVVTCPNCGVCLELEEDDDPENLTCPNCKKTFSLDKEDE